MQGPFAQAALDEFADFTRRVPSKSETRLIRVGDRAFVDLGHGDFDEQTQAEMRHQQMHEYAVVQALGSGPRPATAGEKRVVGRGGTPDAAVRAARAKAEAEKKNGKKKPKKRGKKSKRKKSKKNSQKARSRGKKKRR